MNVQLLRHIDSTGECSTLDFAKLHSLDHNDLIGILKSLESTEKLCSDTKTYNKLELTKEGELISKNGSYEYQIFNTIPKTGINKDDLIKTDNDKIGFAKAMSNKWIALVDKDGVKVATRLVDSVVDKVRQDLANFESIDANGLKDYKKRKLVKETTVKYFIMKKGPKFSLEINDGEEISVIDEELLKRSDFDMTKLKFKKFNLKGGVPAKAGNLHPLLKMRSEYARILMTMGFQEMPTNNYVESSFWNFDALFQPQDHSARDAHDTFFLSEPSASDRFPSEYLHRVQQVHSNGGYGSTGYRNPWKLEEAKKNVMRTHTTAVSARMLYQLAQQEVFEPVKYFSIDRVFRNESLDATHLAEFHQVEGLIADRDLSLGHLKSTIREFFRHLGIERLRFKPAFNPYTEPSMEIFGFHDGLNKWIEIGNSGMFRPEMLLPMGLPEDVSVIAWGLSLERPMMMLYGINNIREMMGPGLDLKKVAYNPICQLGH